MIAYFKKQIADIMNDSDARGDWYQLGLGRDIKQFSNATCTMMNIVDIDKFIYKNHPDVEVLTVEEVNAKIDELYVAEYMVKNDFLMNANLNQKIQNGTIDLDEMLNTWTRAEELEWLYNQGISGIEVSQKIPHYE